MESSPLDKEVLVRRSSFILNGISLVLPYFLLFCSGGEVKIEVNKKLRLDLFFPFFGYSLTMSHSDSAKCRTLNVIGMR